MNALFFLLGITAIISVSSLSSAYAVPFDNKIEGKNFDDEIIDVLPNGTQIHRWSTHPTRILDQDGNYVNYRLFENATIITLETANSGSLVFDKAGCSYNLYHNGQVGGGNNPQIKGISYTLKGKANSSTNWVNVNSINNAACTTSIIETEGEINILGTKTNGLGTFQIELKHIPGQGIKETLKAYNNNPAWNNHNIGFTEKFQVPQIIKFNSTLQYDLSQYNNTVLDRDWIITNKAKLIHLTDKVSYDFGVGFDNLQDVKITWTGGKAYLSLNYLYGNYIVPYQQWIEVDPTFGPSDDTSYLVEANAGAAAGCTATSWVKSTATGRAEIQGSGDPANPTCHRALAAWDITTLPATAPVIDVDAAFTSSGPVNMAALSCDSFRVMNNPATASAGILWNDAGDGSQYVTADTNCRTAGTYSLDLGNQANTDVQATRAAGNTTFAMSVKLTSEARDGSGHSISFVNAAIDLTVVYTIGPPNRINTLAVSDYDSDSVDLSFTAPDLNGGTLQVYQFNYTTPCGIPLTALPNGTTATTYTVEGLSADTCYSFRATAATQYGRNDTGNIVNVTTLAFNQANFTIGSFNFDAENPLILPIRYERIDVNSTHTLVNVTFADTLNLACDLRYTYAGTNHTYHPMTSVVISSSEREASFRFINSTNEITTFHCYDYGGNQSANYVLVQTDFLLLQQIDDFRNGTYGTMGMFGAFDLITLIVVIISMIGLNRTNEAVGGFFCIVAVVVLSFFEIITWWTALVAGLGVVVMIAIAGTRKD